MNTHEWGISIASEALVKSIETSEKIAIELAPTQHSGYRLAPIVDKAFIGYDVYHGVRDGNGAAIAGVVVGVAAGATTSAVMGAGGSATLAVVLNGGVSFIAGNAVAAAASAVVAPVVTVAVVGTVSYGAGALFSHFLSSAENAFPGNGPGDSETQFVGDPDGLFAGPGGRPLDVWYDEEGNRRGDLEYMQDYRSGRSLDYGYDPRGVHQISPPNFPAKRHTRPRSQSSSLKTGYEIYSQTSLSRETRIELAARQHTSVQSSLHWPITRTQPRSTTPPLPACSAARTNMRRRHCWLKSTHNSNLQFPKSANSGKPSQGK